MTNEQMKPSRFLRLHRARRIVRFIRENLAAGHIVQITNHLRAVRYNAKHIGMFKATKSGAYVQRGKAWDCIDYCDVRAFE
jgi:hypothetical protein